MAEFVWLGLEKKARAPCKYYFFVQTDVWWAKEEDFMCLCSMFDERRQPHVV